MYVESVPRQLTLEKDESTNNTNPANFTLDNNSTPGFELQAWDGHPTAMGITVDITWARSIFYIGTDMQLYQLSTQDNKYQAAGRQNATAWPRADSGHMATAYELTSSAMRVYYQSGGELIEAYGDTGVWRDARSMAQTVDTTVEDNFGNLSTPAKVGLAIGGVLIAIALVGTAVAFVLLRRRQRRRLAEADALKRSDSQKSSNQESSSVAGSEGSGNGDGGESGGGGDGSPGSQPLQLRRQGGWFEQEMLYYEHQREIERQNESSQETREIYELPEQRRTGEMLGEGHVHEVP